MKSTPQTVRRIRKNQQLGSYHFLLVQYQPPPPPHYVVFREPIPTRIRMRAGTIPGLPQDYHRPAIGLSCLLKVVIGSS